MKIIDGFPNYSIDENGVVVNNITGRVIKHHTDKKGYKRIGLRFKNKQKKFYIHRLVASVFILNPRNKETVNHKNGVKSDNNVNNLEWMTNEENMKHAYDTGLYKHRHYIPSLLVKKVLEIVLI
jgi:hypothetical protein